MKRGRAMTWRDWFLMVAACLGVVVVITIIARTFELGGNQRGWLDVIGIGVVISYVCGVEALAW